MKKVNVGILTFPISEAGNVPLLNLIDVLYHFSGDIYLITGNAGYDFFKGNEKIHAYGVEHESGANVVTRVVNFIYTQLKISYTLAKIDRNVDLWIFFIGGDYLVLPMLTAKLLRKNVVLAFAASSVQIAFAASSVQMLKSANDSLFKPTEILSKINCTLSNKIILYSENLIKEWNLERYRNKICTAYKHFLDFDKFKMKKKFDERENFVGYIGRFSEEKGTLNFVEAIPRILDERGEIRFLIGGAGQLQDKIEEYLDEKNLNDKVKLTGWIPHDALPDYLNELKLVVLPSYTEGLPNILLEAMACGTPVLATPVGAIPDVIKDGKTGFILENNSPECIAKNILNVLTYPNLDKIVKSTRELVEKEFTYKAAVERYREILEGTLK
jgi:glycosyltransferase involved in cell wall biosynthesis